MRHWRSTLLLFLLAPQIQSQTAPLPDAPGVPPQPRKQASAPSTPALPNPHWLKVEQLPPGTAIAIIELGRGYSTSCTLDSASDTTLACIQAVPYSPPRRLVFPIHNIAAVFTEEVQSGPSLTALLVGLGIGGGIAAGVCNQGSGRTILACSLVGAGIGAGVALGPSTGPHPPRIHRHLIYRAP